MARLTPWRRHPLRTSTQLPVAPWRRGVRLLIRIRAGPHARLLAEVVAEGQERPARAEVPSRGLREPAVVAFVTAYDQYALRAFDAAAVDYIVKPFDDERFEQALERARRAVRQGAATRLAERLLAALQLALG